MSSSIIHNPKHVLGQHLLRELSKAVSKDLKPLSRAESYQRHQMGGSVNFMNYQLREAAEQIRQEEVGKQRELQRESEVRRSNNAKLPRINQSAVDFLREKVRRGAEPCADEVSPRYGQQNSPGEQGRFKRDEQPHRNKRSKILHVEVF